MNWFKRSQLKKTLPYFQEFEEYGDYVPDEESVNKRLQDMGISIVNDISSGDSGVAYLLSNGDVLKITTNKQEGQVAEHIMNSPHPAIIKYKNVWKEGDLYYIIMEHLDKMISDIPDLNAIFNRINSLTDKFNCYDPKCAYDIISRNYQFESMQHRALILDYLLYLKTIPIKVYDFLNSNNVGIKDGQIKFFDIT